MDELESCFLVALWSVLFNKGHEKQLSTEEHMMRESLARTNKAEAMAFLSCLPPSRRLSNTMQRFMSTLRAWQERVWNGRRMWRDEVLENAPEGAGREYYLPHFHRFALQGAVDVLEVMAGDWNGEIGWEGWTSPVAPIISEE